MQVTLRLISLILIATALILLGADVVTSLDKGGEITVRSIDQIWTMVRPGGVDAFRIWAQHHWPAAAVHGFDTVLTLPGWAVTGVPGVLLISSPGVRTPPRIEA